MDFISPSVTRPLDQLRPCYCEKTVLVDRLEYGNRKKQACHENSGQTT